MPQLHVWGRCPGCMGSEAVAAVPWICRDRGELGGVRGTICVERSCCVLVGMSVLGYLRWCILTLHAGGTETDTDTDTDAACRGHIPRFSG